MSLNVRVQGAVTCPKCGTLVPIGSTKPKNGSKKTTKQTGIAVKIDKKIKAFKKSVERTIAFFLKLGLIGAVIYFIYWLMTTKEF